MGKREKAIEAEIEKQAEKLCDNYCKYPKQWDSEPDELRESEICGGCPLTKIIMLSAIYGMV